MTKKYSTKRALIASILALCMCFTMLIGTTFAWFTDSVTSGGNVIQTGKLDVAMYWAEGDEDPAAVSDWNVADGAIFNNDKWEPGYSEAKHIKIANEGTLALKYQMRILANGVVSELADVIDVYYFDDAKQLTRADFVDANKLGTLSEVLNVTYAKNISNTIAGSLEAGTTKTVTLAFKMQETAGNEYQNLSIGSDFTIQLLATQYTSENDSFDNGYDAGADFAPQETPSAMVHALSQSKLSSITIGGFGGATLDTGYSFQPTETFEQASESEYEWAHADFFVYADATVPANSMALAGYYTAFDGFSWGGETCTSTNWIGLSANTDIAAGAENGIRLLGDGMGLPGISYSEICNYGNDGTGFLCGAADLTGANEGTTLYVELRVYKIECQGTCGGHHNSFDCESGEYITIGKFQYTFDDPNVEYLADGSRVRYGENGEVTLEGVDKASVDNGTYYIPDGVTTLNGEVFTQNSDITTVVIPDTITDFGATGVSDTNASSGAFKNSAVETVVLPEGMTEIPAAAFNGAKNLKSVNIPASVETIGVNAFRSTALETLTVPATVETISYGAFRDMTSLTTVTIEGDVHIPNYAFRGCSALRTVYINGENATVGDNMAFCNASSNNRNTNNLTFYVKNYTVAVQVKTCMGVGSNYYIYVENDLVYSLVYNDALKENEEVVNKLKTVKNTSELQNALNNTAEGDIICLMPDVTYDAVTIAAPMAKNVTVFGAEGAVLKGMACDLPSFTTNAVLYGFTLQNVAFEGNGFYLTNVSNSAPWGFVENFTMDGCSFKGDNKDDVLGNRLFDYGTDSPGSHQFINLKITNCTVDTAIQGIRAGALRGECEISGNVITNVAHNAISIRSVQEGTVLVKGNEMSNGGDRALRVGANSATINFVDNVIVNCGDPADASNFKANTLGTVTFSGNTVDGEAWNPLA